MIRGTNGSNSGDSRDNGKLAARESKDVLQGEHMTRSYEVTDEQWAEIAPLIPGKRARRGRPRAGRRRTLNGILYVLQTGRAWEEVPRQYGSPATCWRRLQEWTADGSWERIWRAYLTRLNEDARAAWVEAFLQGRFVPSKRGRRIRTEGERVTRQQQDEAAGTG
jgi:transposase